MRPDSIPCNRRRKNGILIGTRQTNLRLNSLSGPTAKPFWNPVLGSIRLVALGILASSSGILASDSGLSKVGRQPLPIQARVASAAVTPIGHLDPSTRLSLAIGLPLTDPAGLTRLLENLYDPASADYRRYLSPEEFTARFGPSESDYATLIEFVRTQGFEITATHANRTLLNVSAPVSILERALGTRLAVYSHPTEPRTYFAPESAPSLDAGVRILHIAGLDNFGSIKPRYRRIDPRTPAPGVTSRAGSGPSGTYIGTDFRNAYAPGSTLTGAGQSVGIVALDGYFASDITGYASRAGTKATPLRNVLIDGFNGVPSSRASGSANEEVALDIQMAMSMAPGLKEIIVYESSIDSTLANIDNLLNRMATDNSARQLTCSWGFDIDLITQQVFQQYAAQGQSFYLASGDDGAFGGPVAQASDNPYITIVGGTVLSTDASHRWSSETTWDGSGGGISTLYPLPAWQRGIDMTLNHGSTQFRNLPDVALLADNVWSMSDRGLSATYQGTSIAAPLWAGFTAMINEQASKLGKPPVGFINPAVYQLGRDAKARNAFHDITTGNNTSTNNPNQFFATSGYDLCTGWGTPNGTNFITAILSLSPADPLQLAPPFGFTSIDPVRTPFALSSQTYTLTNTGTKSIPWTISGIPSWLNVSPNHGTLAAGGASTEVKVSVNPDDSAVLMGTRSATLSFVNQDSGLIQERTFTLARRNGDFELGDVVGWTLSADPDNSFVDTIDATFIYGGSTIPDVDDSAFVHSGINGMFLGENTQPGSLNQTLPTTVGSQYRITFWFTNPLVGNPNEFRAMWSGDVLYGVTNAPAFGWKSQSIVTTATSNQTELRFEFRNDDNAFGLDDIEVLQLPATSIQLSASAATATGFVLTWTSTPGTRYQLQSQSAPGSAGWSPVGAPVPATASTTSQSISFNSSAPQQYFRVILAP